MVKGRGERTRPDLGGGVNRREHLRHGDSHVPHAVPDGCLQNTQRANDVDVYGQVDGIEQFVCSEDASQVDYGVSVGKHQVQIVDASNVVRWSVKRPGVIPLLFQRFDECSANEAAPASDYDVIHFCLSGFEDSYYAFPLVAHRPKGLCAPSG